MIKAASSSDTHELRKRRRLAITVAVLALLFVVLCIHGIRFVNPGEIETAINKNLGPESDRAGVLTFMQAQHITYTGCSSDLHSCYGRVYWSTVGLIKSYIHIEFVFNENGKLISHNVGEAFVFAWE